MYIAKNVFLCQIFEAQKVAFNCKKWCLNLLKVLSNFFMAHLNRNKTLQGSEISQLILKNMRQMYTKELRGSTKALHVL